MTHFRVMCPVHGSWAMTVDADKMPFAVCCARGVVAMPITMALHTPVGKLRFECGEHLGIPFHIHYIDSTRCQCNREMRSSAHAVPTSAEIEIDRHSWRSAQYERLCRVLRPYVEIVGAGVIDRFVRTWGPTVDLDLVPDSNILSRFVTDLPILFRAELDAAHATFRYMAKPESVAFLTESAEQSVYASVIELFADIIDFKFWQSSQMVRLTGVLASFARSYANQAPDEEDGLV